MKYLYFLLTTLVLTSCFNGNNKSKEPVNFCATRDLEGYESKEDYPELFREKCSTCHFLYKNSTGPELSKITDRIPNKNWFSLFISNEDSLIQAKDEYTLTINQYSNIDWSHNFNELTNDEIDELLSFLSE
ncbi:MAG: c-type cytochrome [Fluviicola sp.]|nr:c-type cytochrome [Fluviicola sp.]